MQRNITDWMVQGMWTRFLILGFRTSPTPNTHQHFEHVVRGRTVSLRWVKHDANLVHDLVHGMLLVATESPVELHEALSYSHGVEALFSVVPFCSHRTIPEMSLLPLPDAIDIDRALTVEQLLNQAHAEIMTFYEDERFFTQLFLSGVIEGTEWLGNHNELLRRFFDESDFERSCSYLFKSMSDLGVDKCDWRAHNFDQAFYRFVTIANAEAAFLNAFKAIEAFIGEPSKNRTEEKLTERLRRMSIEGTEPVGYSEKHPVLERILANHSVRDSIAAHGIGKQKRPLTIAEIIELQAVARYLILASKSPAVVPEQV